MDESTLVEDAISVRDGARETNRGPMVALGVLVLAAVVLSLLATMLAGSFGIPQNDDWSYSKTALLFASTGQLHLQGWGQMFLFGQIVTTLPYLLVLGTHESTLQLYGASAAALVLVSTYLLARRITTRWRSVAVVGVVALTPGFGLLVASYMTDLPSLGAGLLTMVIGARAVRLRSLPWLAAALLAGLWAFTIRETLLAALVAVGVSGVVTTGVTRRFRVAAAGSTGLVLLVCAVLEHFRHLMPAGDVPPWKLSQLHLWVPPTLIPAYLTIALYVLPLSVWAALGLRGRDFVHPGRLIGWALGVLLVAYVAFHPRILSPLPSGYLGVRLTLPNYLDPLSAYWNAVNGRPRAIFSPTVWRLLQELAAVGGVLLTGEMAAALGRPTRLLAAARRWEPALLQTVLFGVFTAAGTVLMSILGQLQWDRYFIVVVPCVGIVLAGRARPVVGVRRIPAVAAALAAVVVLGAVSADLTWSTDARDGTIWAAAQSLVRQGVNPRQINAGLDWAGTYSAHPADKGMPHAKYTYLGARWTVIFSDISDCWIVTLSKRRMPASTVYGKKYIHPYGEYFGKVPVYILHRLSCQATPQRPGASGPGG